MFPHSFRRGGVPLRQQGWLSCQNWINTFNSTAFIVREHNRGKSPYINLFELECALSCYSIALIEDHTANEGLVRIQYIMSGSHSCIPRNETGQPPYFQNRINVLSPNSYTHIYLWEIYIFLGSVWLICCSQICGLILGIYKSLTGHWHMNWGRVIPRKGIHKSDFRCSAANYFKEVPCPWIAISWYYQTSQQIFYHQNEHGKLKWSVYVLSTLFNFKAQLI